MKATLEQWRAFEGVVRAGTFAAAARRLNKSQSAVSHAVLNLQEVLGVRLFEQQGRKAVLTESGRLVYRRARVLLQDARRLEELARDTAGGFEAGISLAVETLYPPEQLLDALDRFARSCPVTRVELIESVLSGAEEALLKGQADLAIAPWIPRGFLGEPVHRVWLQAVAHPRHPLHQLDRTLTWRDLESHRQLVVRDSGTGERKSAGWLEAHQRWTVTHTSTSIAAVSRGLGFAWLPQAQIGPLIEAGKLKPLPLREGARRSVELFLVFADRDGAGPAVERLAGILGEIG